MIIVLTASVVVLLGLVIAVVMARIGGAHVHLAPPVSAVGGRPLPDGEVTSAGLGRVRFDRALRGYRMDQVDDVLDRMRATIAAYEDARPPELAQGTASSAGDGVSDSLIDETEYRRPGGSSHVGHARSPGEEPTD